MGASTWLFHTDSANAMKLLRPLLWSLVALCAAGVSLLEVVVLDSAVLTWILTILILLGMAFWVRKPTQARKRSAAFVLAGWGVAFLATVALTQWNDWRANIQGRRLVEASEAYRREHGSYPAALHELVPRYLPAIPEGKLIMDGGWTYYWRENMQHPILSIRFPSEVFNWDLKVLVDKGPMRWPRSTPIDLSDPSGFPPEDRAVPARPQVGPASGRR